MTVRRNPKLEREIVTEACRGTTDPTALLEHAQARARTLSAEYVADPMLIAEGRKRRKDMREELADCVNHGLFDWQTHPGDPDNELLLEVFALVSQAYSLLSQH